jgi:CHAT domain-containing protein
MADNSPTLFRLRAATDVTPPALPSTDAIELTAPRRLLVGPGARSAGGTGEATVAADEAVRVVFGNGRALWLRADELVALRGMSAPLRDGSAPAWDLDTAAAGDESQRGLLALGIQALELFGIDLKQATAATIAKKVDAAKLEGRPPGLHRCRLESAGGALAPVTDPLPGKTPLLVFLHGAFSNFAGSFGDLTNHPEAVAVREALRQRYGAQVLAFEHPTLAQSPIANALALAEALPDDAVLHLVSHSRGGLIGELMSLAGRARQNDPLSGDLIGRLFGTDATRMPGLPELGPSDRDALAQVYEQDGERLRRLIALLDGKHIQVQRFVRVACPARGTTLASGRLDRWLGVVQALIPDSFAGDLADFLFAVIKERTDARSLPGVEAMLPGSPLARLLNQSGLVTGSDLSAIAGDLEAGGSGRLSTWWSQLKLFVTDWFYGDDHDLVVNTGSMSGGLARVQGAARALEDRGPEVNHFHYFRNRDSLQWLLAGLTRADGQDGGFRPIGEASHREPRVRSALARSRASGTPRPIVVFVPGAMGSTLKVAGDEVWLDYWALLRGGMGRIAIGAQQVVATEPLDDFYGPFVEHLAREHRVELFAYDWRRSVRDNAAGLAALLATLLPEAERQGQALHIAAHSMGGIVARSMIADGGAGAAVWARMGALKGGSRLLMLGTPNHGSHEAVRWLTGFNPTQAKLALLDFTRGTDGLIDIVRHYPGLVELLPFGNDEVEGRFGRRGFWDTLKATLKAGFETPEASTLQEARSTWAKLRGAAIDPERMRYVAGCARATVIDHELIDLGASRVPRLAWIATSEGDGTVSWASGQLPGVPVWYAPETSHDELCANEDDRRLFRGYVDLLRSGRTDQLPALPPRARGAAARTRFELLQPALDALPDVATLRGLGLAGSVRRRRGGTEKRAPIVVTIRHADLSHARQAVLVGHYVGDLIVSAEAHIDRRLDQALTRCHALGRYPGPVGTHAVFRGRPGAAALAGALVVGLGQVGDLTPARLQAGVRDAMLDHAQGLAAAVPPDAPRQSAALSCLLVGSGGAGLAVRDSLESILRAAVDANRRLEAAGLDGRVLIDAIEFVELFEDVAIAAGHALRGALQAGDLAQALRWEGGTVISEPRQGGRKRRFFDTDRAWDQRIEILEKDGMLSFSFAGQRARAEQQLATGQVALAERFIAQAVGNTADDAQVAKTLYEMLLPVAFKVAAPDLRGLVLLLDRQTARFPWELLQDRWSLNGQPLAIEAGIVRQFKTDEYRERPLQAAGRSILIVGDPDLEGWAILQQLPGARAEAAEVRKVFESHWSPDAVRTLLGPRVDAITAAMHEQPWKVLHLAGHGEHEFRLTPETSPRSGMVVGRDTFLGPGDVAQMRHVPELVFINCCHLGRTDGAAPAYAKLAANLGAEFIAMGVRAVVAAGWAVDDEAAATFARVFYRSLLQGQPFRDAVRQARQETRQTHPGVNTWGAYQCYGDPGWRLVPDRGDLPPAAQPDYVSPRELLAELDNLAVLARSRGLGSPKEQRERIEDCLKRIPAGARDAWEARGDVAAGIGFAYEVARLWPEAVQWLDRALTAEVGDCPVRALEKSLNAGVRLAALRWDEARALPAAERERLRLAMRERIGAGLRRFEPVVREAPTTERRALLGSACKRLAWLQAPGARGEVLTQMAWHYRHRFEMLEGDDYYGLANWGAACALLEREHPEAAGQDWHAAMRELVQAQLDRDAKRLNTEVDFWRAAAQGDLRLVLLLLAADDAAALAALQHEVAQAYVDARRHPHNASELGSVGEHLDFLAELTATGWPEDVPKAIQKLRHGLDPGGTQGERHDTDDAPTRKTTKAPATALRQATGPGARALPGPSVTHREVQSLSAVEQGAAKARLPSWAAEAQVTEVVRLVARIGFDGNLDALSDFCLEQRPDPVPVELVGRGRAAARRSALVTLALFPSGNVRTVGEMRMGKGRRAELLPFDHWSLIDPDAPGQPEDTGIDIDVLLLGIGVRT